ncbi:MAG: hypothetical protein M0P35_07335 [Bacteroidales bacterium]|jgi:hypothetical protein|nr:hypothetical protein [Bacteroidales bacterium]
MKANKEAAPKKNAAIPNGVAENNVAKKTINTKCNLQQSYDIYKFNFTNYETLYDLACSCNSQQAYDLFFKGS